MSSQLVTMTELLELGSATLGEAGAHAMRDRIMPAWRGAKLAGPAFTVRCTPGDNLAVHVAVMRAPEGSVLVVNVGDVPELGYWGEVLTTAAEARGIAGLVIDGGARDTSALKAHKFPVFASTIALRGATKENVGEINVEIRCADVPVKPGDWVVGDSDGVVVIPEAKFEQVIAAGRERAEKEAQMFKALRGGETTVGLLGLDPSLITDPLFQR